MMIDSLTSTVCNPPKRQLPPNNIAINSKKRIEMIYVLGRIIFAIFSDFGLYNYSIKEMSRHTGSLEDYCGSLFSLRLILSVIVFGVLLLILPILPFPRETKLIIVLIGAYQVIFNLVNGFTAVFIAREEMYLASFLEFSLKAVTSLVGIATVIAGGSLVLTLATFPAVAIVQVFVAYGIVTSKQGRPKLVATWSYFACALREATPYGLASVLFRLSARVDVLFLGFFIGAAAAGVYNVAYRVIFFLQFTGYYAGVALFPLASRLYVSSRKDLQALYRKSLNITILIAFPAACGLWLIAPGLIDLVFGDAFAESASVLRLLSGLVFLVFLNHMMGVFLMSCDQQIYRTRCYWTAAWVNVLGNLLLIPIFGIKGAAVATLLSETLLSIRFVIRLRDVLGWPQVGSRLAISSMAVASFFLPFVLFPSLSLFVVIPASTFIYLGTLLLFKDIRRKEVRTLVTLLRDKYGTVASKGQGIS